MADDVFTEGQDQEQSLEDMVKELLAEQQKHRAEVAAMREEIAKSKPAAPSGAPALVKSAEQLYEERIASIRDHSHYCPGCGALSKYIKPCSGTATAPHPPIDMVSVEELLGDDASLHTAAPSSENLG